MQEKMRALTLLQQGIPVMRVAAQLQVTRMAIYNLKKAAATLPPGTVPARKAGSGAPKKTSLHTDKILKQEVMSDPFITAVELKEKHPALLKNVSVRTIQHRLQKDLKMRAGRVSGKPLLSEELKNKLLVDDSNRKYKDWTSEQRQEVMLKFICHFTHIFIHYFSLENIFFYINLNVKYFHQQNLIAIAR